MPAAYNHYIDFYSSDVRIAMGKTLHNTIRLGRRSVFDHAIDAVSAFLGKLLAAARKR